LSYESLENILVKTEKKQDHRLIAQELDLYILNEQAGQGLLILLPN
jgi:threonyl-tRNA synthetase